MKRLLALKVAFNDTLHICTLTLHTHKNSFTLIIFVVFLRFRCFLSIACIVQNHFLGLPKSRQGKRRPQRSDSPRWKNIGRISCQIIQCQIGNWLLERKDFSLEFLVGWWWCPWLSSLWKRLWPFSSEGKFSVASRSFATTAF